MNKITFYLVGIFLIFSKLIFAENQKNKLFTSDSTNIYATTYNKPEQFIYLDSTLNNFHLNHPAYQQFKTPFYFDLGNLGQPIYNYQQKLNTPFGFNFQKPEYEALRFDINNMQLYQTNNKVYSELFYTLAMKSESFLDAHHSQKISKNILLDARYRYMNAEGIYLRQLTKIHNLFLNTTFISNNERFNAKVGFLFNKLSWQENGGTTVDSVFELAYINKNVVPIRLNNASTIIKENTFRIANSYGFGKHYNKKINDTLSIHHYVPFFTIEHILQIDNHYRTSKDGAFDSLNYNALPITTEGDTFFYKQIFHVISNTFKCSLVGNKKLIGDSIIVQRAYLMDVSAEHQLLDMKSYNYKNDTSNLNVHASFRSNPFYKSDLKGEITFDYSIVGYNKNDNKITTLAAYSLPKQNVIYGSFVSHRYHPNFSLLHFKSEYFSVNNSLPITAMNQIKLGWRQLKYKFKLEYNFSIWDKYNYISDGFNAATINNATVSIIKIEKEFSFKKFHFINLLQLNSVNTSKTIFPKWMNSAQIYYQSFAFKKALFLQTGFQLVSYEKYFAPYFMPLADNFYYQNQTQFSQQHQLQFFVNAKIKKVRIFVKADNLLQGLDGHGTYVSKYYPLPDRTLKFGISWRFLD